MDSWVIVSLYVSAYLLLCGGIGAYCSAEKARPCFEGFLFGALLGPFGVIAAACLPNLERPANLDQRGRPIKLTADRDDIDDPEELARFLKRRN